MSLALSLALPGLGCIQDRLDVEITTQVRPDGSCRRRVEYRVERKDLKTGEAGALDPAKDPLRRLHRFPSGEPWVIHDEVAADRHVVTVEAELPSPEAVAGDYWRVHTPGGRPARNHVFFAQQAHGETATYEFIETLADPLSPQQTIRHTMAVLSKSEDAFASAFARALPSARPDKGAVKRAYHRSVVLPVSRELAALAAGPASGRWQRRRFERLLDRLDGFDKELDRALTALAPGASSDEVTAATKAAGAVLDARFEKEMGSEEYGWLLENDDVRFHVTLVMPGHIVRANTCFASETATWEFDLGDLYGPGFEMWAVAETE